MLCEKCNKRVATIHLIKLINGEKSEVRLCESCAKEISDISLVGSLGSIDEISIPNILGGFFESIDKNKPNKIEVICKKCGLTYSQFKASGQLGCDECYIMKIAINDRSLISIEEKNKSRADILKGMVMVILS